MIYLPALMLALVGLLVMIRRRQAILLFMGAEMILAAGNWIALLAVTPRISSVHIAIILVFSLAVAAAEATVGLSIVLRLAHRYQTTDVGAFESLKDREE
ncbi:MAG: NADH-ubiquinone oxidoreductase subunit 4L [Sulfobacillus thermosulfidooxidans]|uniref:NADH-ubiquinone oxidoreductase subunit 4L n=1 Tax=Sulfobacillus thermosulfidooxidans TaxID=28034 RepID=A0A2T2WTM7_SULTH|nr:MAG: NADH-ubiquinone oxidoreductase subunit 4L [Sulfobacillus thermosulfidooxidans]